MARHKTEVHRSPIIQNHLLTVKTSLTGCYARSTINEKERETPLPVCIMQPTSRQLESQSTNTEVRAEPGIGASHNGQIRLQSTSLQLYVRNCSCFGLENLILIFCFSLTGKQKPQWLSDLALHRNDERINLPRLGSSQQKTDGGDSIDTFCVPEWHAVFTLTIYNPY